MLIQPSVPPQLLRRDRLGCLEKFENGKNEHLGTLERDSSATPITVETTGDNF